jgi:hypothetical protein
LSFQALPIEDNTFDQFLKRPTAGTIFDSTEMQIDLAKVDELENDTSKVANHHTKKMWFGYIRFDEDGKWYEVIRQYGKTVGYYRADNPLELFLNVHRLHEVEDKACA